MEQSVTLERFDEALVVVAVMTKDEAIASEQRILSLTTDLRAELLRFYEGRGWAALGHSSWRAWAAIRLGDTERKAYYELTAGQVERILNNCSNDAPQIGSIPESHLRPLAPLRDDPDLLRDTWDEAHHIAEERGERFTARHVTEAVQAITALEVFPPVTRFNEGMRSSDSPEWYTPSHILDLAWDVMGAIDLDPASSQAAQATVGAAHWFGLDHPTESHRDGLALAWFGHVWMNPPYGDEIGEWVDRLIHQYETGQVVEALALLPSRTDTAWFHRALRGKPYPICLVQGRLKFSGAENSAPFPSVIVYLGENVQRFHEVFSSIGMIR